ncbi:MAG: DMT family transporter [Kiritimatiellaeota bacterium]|nr:DMT family transporter [Kiritimatiellota bacterium]
MKEERSNSAPLPLARRLLLAGLLLGVVAVWGWTFVIVKDAVAIYGVLPFLAVRFTLGAACLGAVCARRVKRRTFRTGAAIGLVLGVAFLLQTFGLARTSASNTGLITGLFVVFAPLANRMFFGVRIRGALWAAIGLSLIGLALLTGAGSSGFGLGELLTLGCAALFGLHVALLDRYAKGHDATVLAFGQLAGAAILFLAFCAGTGGLVMPPAGVWFALIITGVFASAIAYLVQTYVQQRLSAVETALIMLLEPLFAVLFGFLLQGDRMTPLQISGGVLMIVTMALTELRGQKPAATADRPAAL